VKALVVTGIALAMIAMALLVWYMSHALPRATVMEEHSGFDKSKFVMLLFPTPENDVCRRAVIATLDEYERDAVEVHGDTGVIAVARDRFTAAPPPEYPTFVKRLNEELALWGEETDWSNIEWDFESDMQGITAMLLLRDKSGTLRKYTYLIRDTSVHPISRTTILDIAKKMAN